MFSLRKPSAGELSRLVAEQSELELTYPEHGATDGEMPAGYHRGQWQADLGPFTQERFERLAADLSSWQVQLGSGMTITPAESVSPGLTFALSFGLTDGFGYVIAAGRVVYVTEEPERRGFAYGTLPAHPERGEEAFHLMRQGTSLLFQVQAFSRPQHPLARLGAPVARILQQRMNHRYLAVMRAAAARLDQP
ncbi:MAG TPA: DUF1990 domain-containing protein [Streptosporangiaceae bacterium]|nr:DUF1990 domain-containing protein [Streptosporangiaceae bacterium]